MNVQSESLVCEGLRSECWMVFGDVVIDDSEPGWCGDSDGVKMIVVPEVI